MGREHVTYESSVSGIGPSPREALPSGSSRSEGAESSAGSSENGAPREASLTEDAPTLSPREVALARHYFTLASAPLAEAMGIAPTRKPRVRAGVKAEVERFFEAKRQFLALARGRR